MIEHSQLLVPHYPVLDKRVREVMSRNVATASPGEPLKDAAARMIERDVSVLPVVDGAGEISGVISDSDMVRVVTTPHRGEVLLDGTASAPPRGKVEDVMSRHVIGVREDADVSQVARLMVEQGLKALPVVDHGRLVGVVSRRDVLRLMVRSDEDIHREVSETLDLVTERPLTYEVKDGVVTFEHWVEPGGRRYLEHAIKKVPGVFAVVYKEIAP